MREYEFWLYGTQESNDANGVGVVGPVDKRLNHDGPRNGWEMPAYIQAILGTELLMSACGLIARQTQRRYKRKVHNRDITYNGKICWNEIMYNRVKYIGYVNRMHIKVFTQKEATYRSILLPVNSDMSACVPQSCVN